MENIHETRSRYFSFLWWLGVAVKVEGIFFNTVFKCLLLQLTFMLK